MLCFDCVYSWSGARFSEGRLFEEGCHLGQLTGRSVYKNPGVDSQLHAPSSPIIQGNLSTTCFR